MAGMFSKPKLPPKQDPVRLPDPQDRSARDAAARRRRDLIGARGRESTNLTDTDQTSYASQPAAVNGNTQLGQ